MPRAGYSVSLVGGVPVVATPGEIDVTNAAEFGQSLQSCLDGQHSDLIVDMSETAFCDSAGVHQLIRARKRVMASGGKVRLVVRTAPVLRLFAIMGIDRLLPVFASLDDALAAGAAPAARPETAAADAIPGPAAQHC